MTPDKARELIIEHMNYAAYRETDFSLHDSDKNRLFGAEHWKSDRPVYQPSHWDASDFEEQMATLFVWASVLSNTDPVFAEAQALLEAEESILGRVIRRAKEQRKEKARA